MRTHVTFLTKAFNLTKQKSHFINEANFGEDLANWLIVELNKCNFIKVDVNPLQEDWERYSIGKG
jgi:hypothetical protein